MERGLLLARFPGIRWTTGRPAMSGFGELRQRRISRRSGYLRQAEVDAARCGPCGIGAFADGADQGGGNFSSTTSWWAGRP